PVPVPQASSTAHAYHIPPRIGWHAALPCATISLESGPIAPGSTLPCQVPPIPKTGAIAFTSSPGLGAPGFSCDHATPAAIPPQPTTSSTNPNRPILFMALLHEMARGAPGPLPPDRVAAPAAECRESAAGAAAMQIDSVRE